MLGTPIDEKLESWMVKYFGIQAKWEKKEGVDLPNGIDTMR